MTVPLLQLALLIRGVGEVPVDVEAQHLDEVIAILETRGYIPGIARKTDKPWVFYKTDIAGFGLRIVEAQQKPSLVRAATPIILPANGRTQ